MEPVQMVVVGVIVAIGVIAAIYARIRDDHTSITSGWPGDIVAVVVTLNDHARLKGDEEPQSAGILIRSRDTGAEHLAERVLPSQLPRSITSQVYDPGWVINTYRPNFRLPKEHRAAAVDAAANGGFRYDLPETLPVSCETDDRGVIRWSFVTS